MAKGKKTGSKKRKLTAIIVFAFLVLAAAGIVLGITYWPAKASDITSSFDAVLERSLDTEDDQSSYFVVKSFIDQNITRMTAEAQNDTSADDKKDGYVYEMKSFENIFNSLKKIVTYLNLTFESSIEGKFIKRDVKSIQSYLNDFSVKLDSMASHIKNHKDEMTTFTVVLGIWEGVRDYYENLVKDIDNTFNLLSIIYTNQNTKGVYGNIASTLSIKAIRSYLNVIYKGVFNEDETSNPETSYNASLKLANFANIYNLGDIKYILDYYLNSNLRKNFSSVSDLEYMTDGKVDFEYLIEHNFDVNSLSLTEKQKSYVGASSAFLKAEDLSTTLFVKEVA